jgi:GT2 family glycosyltransferase
MMHSGPNIFQLEIFPDRISRPDVRDHLTERFGVRPSSDCLGFFATAKINSKVRNSLTVTICDKGAFATSSPFAAEHVEAGNPKPLIELIAATGLASGTGIFDFVGPLIQLSSATHQRTEPHFRRVQFGDKASDTKVSIIVPLFARVDFVEHQLVHFSRDNDFKSIELIYVLDDPRLTQELERAASVWHSLYKIPFEIVFLDRNVGFSRANNIGARIASADTLLLLNSDVFPKESGWLTKLERQLHTLPSAGIITPRLLLPNGAIQYEGMSFVQRPFLAPYWLNHHPGKGFPPIKRENPYQVSAATGACLMISTDLYRRLGGLDPTFVIGDFEDSDLSLKVRNMGLTIWCDSNVELYHLERQSVSATGHNAFRNAVTIYNAWQHHLRWAEQINKLETGGQA